ncbi:MAG: GNAT family N-acetyltransferase [Rhodospirillaceae bacterium]|nr:GNAT family N-acetyltransferase [Rhodospirillaceae bacterium]
MRAFQEPDIAGVVAMYADEDFSRFITFDGKPYGRENSWRSMSNIMGHWALRGYGMWAVVETASNDLVGFAGPHFPEGWPAKEVGWAIGKDYWGKGYATEAAQAAMDYARTALKWPHVIHVINPLNTRSITVAERLGSAREGQWIRDGKELWLYGQDLK